MDYWKHYWRLVDWWEQEGWELEGTLRSEVGETEGRRKGGDWSGIELRRRIVWQAGARGVNLMLLAQVLGMLVRLGGDSVGRVWKSGG